MRTVSDEYVVYGIIKMYNYFNTVSVNVFMHQLSMCIAGGMYLIETSACLVCLQSIISCRHVVSHASQASHSASAQTAISKHKK